MSFWNQNFGETLLYGMKIPTSGYADSSRWPVENVNAHLKGCHEAGRAKKPDNSALGTRRGCRTIKRTNWLSQAENGLGV
jgi:hypothetical protein